MNLWLRRQTRHLLSVGLVVTFALGLAAAQLNQSLAENTVNRITKGSPQSIPAVRSDTKGGSTPAPRDNVGASKSGDIISKGGTRPRPAQAGVDDGAGRIGGVSKGGKASVTNSGDTGRIGGLSKGGRVSVTNSGAMDNAASAITDSNLGNVAGNAGGAGSARNPGAKSKGDSVPKVSGNTGNAQATAAAPAPATRNTKQGASTPARQPAATTTDPNMPVDYGGCPGCSKGGDDLRVR
jgi:hypothetical protein